MMQTQFVSLTRVGNTCDTLADTVDLKTFSYYSKYTNYNSPTIVLMSKGKEGCYNNNNDNNKLQTIV